MKIHVEFLGFLKLRRIAEDPVVEMPEGSTIKDLYAQLGMADSHQGMQAFINKDAAWEASRLKDGDEVTIISIVSGG